VDRWLRAIESISKFLGLDVRDSLNARIDAEDIEFTIIFDTPDDIYEDAQPMALNGSQDGDR